MSGYFPVFDDLTTIYDVLEKYKMLDISIIDSSQNSNVFNYVICATALSARHAKSSANLIMKDLKALGMKKNFVSGHSSGDWIVIDMFTVSVNIFRSAVRRYYDIESIWLDGHNCKTIDPSVILYR